MCCIIAVAHRRPPTAVIRDAATSNKDGIGVMFLRKREVVWLKGISVETAVKLSRSLPMPFAMHFRFATVGGPGLRLAHPFPIERKPSVAMTGTTSVAMMHNGHVSGWEKLVNLPKDARGWSDSRAIASYAARHGVDALETMARWNRFAVLSHADGLKRFGTWIVRDGYHLSSDPTPVSYYYGQSWGEASDASTTMSLPVASTYVVDDWREKREEQVAAIAACREKRENQAAAIAAWKESQATGKPATIMIGGTVKTLPPRRGKVQVWDRFEARWREVDDTGSYVIGE